MTKLSFQQYSFLSIIDKVQYINSFVKDATGFIRLQLNDNNIFDLVTGKEICNFNNFCSLVNFTIFGHKINKEFNNSLWLSSFLYVSTSNFRIADVSKLDNKYISISLVNDNTKETLEFKELTKIIKLFCYENKIDKKHSLIWNNHNDQFDDNFLQDIFIHTHKVLDESFCMIEYLQEQADSNCIKLTSNDLISGINSNLNDYIASEPWSAAKDYCFTYSDIDINIFKNCAISLCKNDNIDISIVF